MQYSVLYNVTIYYSSIEAALELYGIRFCSPLHTATSCDVIVMHKDQRHWDNENVMHLYRDTSCHLQVLLPR